MQIYVTDKRSLAFYKQEASADFWDKHWSAAEIRSALVNSTDDGLFIPAIMRYLPKESVVLEGGCGRGQIVSALQVHGYKSIGVDFASETIGHIKQAAPELDVRLGDVRNLDLPSNSLDGYISAGVIEHLWDGYEAIIKEMHRTLKAGGFLFVSFPYLSPLRRLKIGLRMYPFEKSVSLDRQRDLFYQFALSEESVVSDLESLGFQLKERLTYDGIKGFKDEVPFLKPYLQQVYEGKRDRMWRSRLNRLFLPFAAHCTLLIMQAIK